MLLQLIDVEFGFKEGTPLLRGFNLTVERGEFIALLGPSGCGKSTIMNLAAGLLKPWKGKVVFDGVPLTGVNTKVGYMTQGDTLLPWLTVAKNVLLPLEIRGLPAADRKQKLDKAVRLVNLDEAREYYPSQLSGGMRRRALLARSLVYDPPMLLMDEPFAALDAQLREVMHKELLATVARLGETVVFVTHDIAESILLADRVWMLGGQPLRLLDEVVIPWGKDRNLDTVRLSPEYAQLEARLRAGVGRANSERAQRSGVAAS